MQPVECATKVVLKDSMILKSVWCSVMNRGCFYLNRLMQNLVLACMLTVTYI